jgi:hypothetical protein
VKMLKKMFTSKPKVRLTQNVGADSINTCMRYFAKKNAIIAVNRKFLCTIYHGLTFDLKHLTCKLQISLDIS